MFIYYLGDLEPSGVDINRALEEAMRPLGTALDMYEIHFERLAVNPRHVRKYSLPDWPERRETVEKMERDSRYEKYLKKHGKIACELDSFVGIASEELKRMARANVRSHFDEEVYARTKEEEGKAKEKIVNEVKKLTEKW